MKKRALSWLLAVVMVVSLAPQTIPWAKAADEEGDTSSKDAFGLPTEVDQSQQNKDLSSNPYGTKGWVPLFQNHELVVAGVHDDEFQTTYHGATKSNGEQISSFRWSNSTDVGNAKRIATVAFDPNGTGRDEYIANLVFDASAQELRLYVTNKERKVSNVVPFGTDSKFIKELKFYQTRSMLCLTAGDFDGDGNDTLMVYVPGNNTNTDSVDSIHEFSLNGNTLKDEGQKINLGDVLDGGREALKAMLYHDGNGSNELRAHLSVDMEAGDVDLDGVEELAMTVNVNDLKNSKYGDYSELEKSYLTVYDGNDGWKLKEKWKLLNSNGGAQGRARFAGVTIGNFSSAPSNGVAPEVIAVGYYDKNDNYKDCSLDTGKLLLYSYQYQPGKTEAESKWNENYKAQELSANGFTGTGTKGDDNQNPVAVAAVSADGAMTQEYLFVSGSMYQASKTDGSRLTIVDGSGMDKNRGIGGYIINNTGILDYAVGNFDGNPQGREQVYYVEYHKQESFHKEFLCIGQLYKTASVTGKDEEGNKIYQSSENFKRWTDGWTYYGKKNCNVAITAADVNEDAVLAKIKEISYGYTDPKVMAILEASPHFSELDSFGNSATSFGQKVGDQTGVSASGSFGFDVMAGFEYVAPIIETGGGIELNTSHTFTVGGGTTNTKEVEIKYANDNAEKNSVVMYATPMAYYLYDVKYPKGTQPKKESTMMLSVAMKPVTSIVSVDTYNEAAAAYADMDQIGANVQLGTPGQPNTYRAGLPNASDEHSWRYGEAKQYYGTGTITESITKSTDTRVSFEYEYEGSVQAYGIAGGFKVGGGYHWGVSAGTEKVSTEGLTKEGAVNCQNNPHYNFNWEFATWTVKLNGEDVPVLGYLVNNVVAPPSPAENLRLSEQTTNSMVLSWDSGARPAEYYKIYRYIEGRKNPFVLVDTVDASEAASGSYEYTLTGLAPNTQYQYAITSGYYTGNNESVESEIAIGKTLASDMERLHISGPGNVTALLGQQASFSVTVSGPATYRDFAYQWQMRQPGKKWEDIEDATQENYTVSEVTSNLNGTMFRCMVEGNTSSSEPIPFYSDAAMLTVGMPTADATLKVTEHKGGKGTKDEPFIGQSDYLTIGKGEAVTETKITSYTATATTADNKTIKLDIYKVDDTTPTAYIGIGTDASGNTVYYSVTANEDATKFTAGTQLKESTVYTWKNGSEELKVPNGISPESALTEKLGDGDQKTTYYQAVALNETTHEPTDYLYRDSKVYTTSGAEATGVDSSKLYLVHSKTDSQYILSRNETTSSAAAGSETDGAGDTTETKYYELKITTTQAAEEGGTATTTYALSSALTYTAKHKIDIYTNPTFTLHQTETQETVTPETRKAGNGTALLLTTTTTNTSNNDESLSVDYTLTITNTSTGTVSTLTGKTGTNGRDTKTWTAPVSGLYAITTTTAGGTASEPQYYLAGVQTVQEDAESTTETVYTLDSEISGEYGSSVALKTRQQTIQKNNDKISAGTSSVVNGVTYKYRLASATNETSITGTGDSFDFDAPKAGTYVVSAYDKDGKKLASTTINIKRKPIKLSVVLPSDQDDHQSYNAPTKKSEITFTGQDKMKSGDTLPNDAILINCDLYDSNGIKRDTSGRFEITLSLNNGENALAATKKAISDLLEKYEFTFVSRKVISEQQTGTVAYSAGEGGKVVARKGANSRTFTTGAAVAYNSVITFDATPRAGYMVKEWLVNGTPVTSDAAGNYVLSDETVDGVTIKNKRLTVKSFSSNDLKDGKLTVEVKFGSDSHKITFSAGEGGSLTAKLKDGATLTNPQDVPEGAEVTFTAAPDNSKGVQRWTVDGNPYYWPGTTDLYRETTLTLKNISDDRTVHVDFTAAATHTITTGYTTENAETVTGVSISAKLASGADIDLTKEKVQDGAAVTFTVNGLTSNHTVKEWLVDGQTATGSNGQTSFTLRDIKGNHTVKAVIAVATAHTLTFKAIGADGEEITDASIAKLTATSRGKTITSGSRVAAYTPIDFNVEVGENYYVKLKIAIRPGMKLETEEDGWSDNVTVDPEDIHKATLTDWNADTLVTVTVKEKPVVTFNDGAKGKLTVKYSHDGQDYTLDASSPNHHVEYGERIYVTATPDDGYYVASIVIAGSEHGTMVSSTLDGRNPGAVTRETVGLLDQDGLTVSATYARKPVVTFTGDDHITVTAKQGDKELKTGDWVDKFSGDIVFTAKPKVVGYETASWTVDEQSGVSYQTVSGNDDTTYTKEGAITSDVTVSVTGRAIPQPTLTMSVETIDEDGAHGTLKANVTRKNLTAELTQSGTFYRDSNLTITATPDQGYRVQSWTIDGKTTESSALTQTLTNCQNPVSVTVRFVKLGAGITFTKEATGGVITEAKTNTGLDAMPDAEGGVTLGENISITLTAKPHTGYEVKDWLVNGISQKTGSETFTYTSDGNTGAHITPVFQTIVYDITAKADPDNIGKVTISGLTNGQARGSDNLTFEAIPNPGYIVTGWTINGQNQNTTGNSFLWTVPVGKPVSTVYEVLAKMEAGKYTLTYDQPDNGSLTASSNGKTVENGADDVLGGTKITFTATPDEHYEVDHWTVGEQTQNGGNTLDVTVASNTTVSVTYKLKQYSVDLTQGANGTARAPQTGSVNANTDVTFTATPETGYHLKHWLVNGETRKTETNSLNLTITGNTQVQPVFEIDALTVNYGLASDSKQARIQATVNGVALTSGSTVPYGSNVTFTVTPSGTDMVDSWSVNGQVDSENKMTETKDAETIYTVTNVTSSKDIQVKVIERPNYTVTVANNITNGSVSIVGGENGKITVPRNGSVTLKATAKDVYNMFGSWSVNGETLTQEKSAELKLDSIKKDTTVSATFRGAVSYNVTLNVNKTAVANENVSVTVKNATQNQIIQPGTTSERAASVLGGSKLVFTANDAEGNTMVGAWKINGQVQDNLSKEMVINGLTGAANVEVTFVPEVLYSIPGNGSNYTVTEIQKVPRDYGTEQQIRAGGTVEFEVKAKDVGKSITEIELNKCGDVTTTPQADGSIKVTIKNVKANIELTDVKVVSSIPLRITTPSNGTITVKKGGTALNNGDKVMEADELTITATPKSNYALDTLTVTGAEQQPNGVYKVKTGVTEVTVAATFKSTGGGGGGGGGGGAVSTYTLTFDTNGGSAIDKITKDSGTTIDLAAYKPTRAGYTFAGWFSDKALTKAVTSVKLTANTTVYAKWTQNGGTAQNPFVDVKEGAYYYDAVLWAVEQKITSGTSATTFSPDASCTRAQMVTFLWRAAGSPKVENGKNPFTDVKADAYYYDAVLWAVEKGVTSGTSATTFSPDATVTRGQTVTFLYRNAGSPEVSGTMPFTDVEADAYYAKAVQWAVQQKITTGTSETTFSPMSDCTRGQIVTFLYRAK